MNQQAGKKNITVRTDLLLQCGQGMSDGSTVRTGLGIGLPASIAAVTSLADLRESRNISDCTFHFGDVVGNTDCTSSSIFVWGIGVGVGDLDGVGGRVVLRFVRLLDGYDSFLF